MPEGERQFLSGVMSQAAETKAEVPGLRLVRALTRRPACSRVLYPTLQHAIGQHHCTAFHQHRPHWHVDSGPGCR